MGRMRAWLVVSPVIAAGVLAAHALAYRLTATPADSLHEYLAHAPQVLLVLALAVLALAGFGPRCDAPRPWVFPLAAIVTFVAQEHVEWLVHGQGVPILVATPVFLVGLALQVPVALVAWVLARRLLRLGAENRPQRSLRSQLEFVVLAAGLDHVAATALPSPLSRGPPVPIPSR